MSAGKESENQEKENAAVEVVAVQMYDFACAARSKKGDPREVGCEFDKLFDEPKAFYRSLAKWHLGKMEAAFDNLPV